MEAQAGQRRAQVVGHRSDHRGSIIDVAPQPLLHVVEGAGGHADLRGAVQLQRGRAGVAAEPFGSLGEGGDGGRHPPREQEGQGRGHHHAGQQPQQHALPPRIQQTRVLCLDDAPTAVAGLQPHPERADQHGLAGPLRQLEQARGLAAAEVAPAQAAAERLELHGAAHRPAGEHHVRVGHAQVVGDVLLGAEAVPGHARRGPLGLLGLDAHLQQLARGGRQVASAQHLFDVAQLVDLGLGSRQGEDHRRIDQHHGQHTGQAEAEHQDEQRQSRSGLGAAPDHLQTTGASNI